MVVAAASAWWFLDSGDNTTPWFTYTVVESYPHDPSAFTQGLVFHGGFIYEGTGLNGRSSLREVDIDTGGVLRIHNLSSAYFGEGIALHQGKIYQVTYRSRIGFVYDLETFETVDTFEIATEGWGLTHDGSSLIMSDGTSTLRFIDFDNFEEKRTVEVRDGGVPVTKINELEYVDGEVYANIWKTDLIARIDPGSGRVTGWLDLAGLKDCLPEGSSFDVLNGIAYDSEGDHLFVTGKLWPRLFEIEITPMK